MNKNGKIKGISYYSINDSFWSKHTFTCWLNMEYLEMLHMVQNDLNEKIWSTVNDIVGCDELSSDHKDAFNALHELE